MSVAFSPTRKRTALFLASSGLALSLAAPATAQSNDFGIYIAPGESETVTVAEGEVVAGSRSGIFSENFDATIRVNGEVRGNGMYDGFEDLPDGGIVLTEGSNLVANGGLISGAGTGITTAGYYNPDTQQIEARAVGTGVVNSGVIRGDYNDGIRLIGGGTITNSGTIEAVAGEFADGISAYRHQMQDPAGLERIATLVNEEGGSVLGDRYGVAFSGGGTVENAGDIVAAEGGVLIQSYSFDDPETTGEVVNSGLISGADGISTAGTLGVLTITNSGEIVGTNPTEGRGSDGGQVGAAIVGGAASDLVVTNLADGTITGESFGIVSPNARLVLDNAGTIRGNGGGYSADGFPEGGVTLASADSVITNSGDISGAFAGIITTAQPQLDEETQEEVRVGVARNTVVTNSGTITGEVNDGVLLVGGGTLVNSGLVQSLGTTGTSDGFSAYAFDDQELTGEQLIFVVNEEGGAISGFARGISSSSGGDISNAGEISGGTFGVLIQNGADVAIAGGLVNSGEITGGQAGAVFYGDLADSTIQNSGSISSAEGAGLELTSLVGDFQVTNEVGGAITGGTSGIVSERGAMTLQNAGTIRGNGSYDGFERRPDAGVAIASAGTSVANSGTISGAGAGITTYLQYEYDEETQSDLFVGTAVGTEVVNSGVIRGETNDGVRLIGGGTITNSGTIEALAGEFADGISMYAFEGQDTSGSPIIGTVENAEGGTISGTRFGIILTGGGIIDNAGTIVGPEGAVLVQAMDEGRTADITNSGTLDGGLVSIVQTSFENSGTVAGGVTLSALNDEVLLGTGSGIAGLLDAGDGVDAVTLNGSLLERSEQQVLGATAGVEQLAVEAGYWTAGIDGFAVSDVAIGAGATFEAFRPVDGGDAAVKEIDVAVAGTLVLNVETGAETLELDALSTLGSGNVLLSGGGDVLLSGGGLAHDGGTTVADGTLQLTGSLAGDVLTQAGGTFVLGDGETSGDFTGNLVNDGTFVFARTDDYDFLGDFSGSGLLTKQGGGTLFFEGAYEFVGTTEIEGGRVVIAGQIDPETEVEIEEGELDITGDQTVSGLSGGSGATVNVDFASLTIDEEMSSTFAGSITGNGSLTVSGNGLVNLTGNNTYSGPTTVQSGTLAVNGSVVSNVTVQPSAKLGGNGTVGSTSIAGGTLAPGNSIGRLTVAGDLDFAAGAVYEVETNAAGEADRTDATGDINIAETAVVEVLAETGDYAGVTDYTILTAGGEVNGSFGGATSNLAFLTPRLGYTSNTVTLTLLRNDVDFTDIASGDNQIATAGALSALGIGNPLYEELLVQSDAGARAAFTSLSGEIYGSVAGALTNEAAPLRRALLDNARNAEGGAAIWGNALGSWGEYDGSGAADIDADNSGAMAGVGFGGLGFSVGIGAGVGSLDLEADAIASSANVASTMVGAFAGFDGLGLIISVGTTYAWHEVDSSRSAAAGSFSDRFAADYDADTWQLFGEVSYDLPLVVVGISPFARFAHVETSTDGVTEAGGETALTVAGADNKTQFASLGVRIAAADTLPVAPYASVAWEHSFGDREGVTVNRFGGGNAFTIEGVGAPKDAALLEAGLTARFGATRLGAAYSGTVADEYSTHGGRITATLTF